MRSSEIIVETGHIDYTPRGCTLVSILKSLRGDLSQGNYHIKRTE